MKISESFPRYEMFDPLVPVYQITDGSRSVIHRFYDTSPISPSGRYIALNELPFEDHLPGPSDEGAVMVLDLQTGEEVFRQSTRAWDTQLGAQAQWGASDHSLFFNVRDEDDMPRARHIDIFANEATTLRSSVYMVSPDGRHSATPSLSKLCLVQPGYGLIMHDAEKHRHAGAPGEDGLFISDTRTGETRLLLSLAKIVRTFPDEFSNLDLENGGLYGFHVKWSPDGSRLMFIVRWLAAGKIARRTRNYLITCDANGDDLHMPVNDARWQGGHHPNWCPDSRHIVMNLRFSSAPRPIIRLSAFTEKVLRRLSMRLPFQLNPLRFALLRYDGSQCRPVPGGVKGSGHPTLSPDLKYLLSDAYPYEDVAPGDGTVPLRLVDVADGSVRTLLRIHCRPAFNGPNAEFRVDPHPAWHAGKRWITFNGCPNGNRGVYVADLSALLDK